MFQALGGAAMKTKDKLLLIWILVVVAIGVLLSHFCGGAIHAFEHFIASGFHTLPRMAKCSAVACVAGFLAWPL